MILFQESRKKADMLVEERLKIPMMVRVIPSVMPETDEHIIIDFINPILRHIFHP